MAKNKLEISPSLLDAPRNFSSLEKILAQLVKRGIKWVHIDVMDGKFVKRNTTKWQNPQLVKKLKKAFPRLKIEVHLMVQNPEHLFSAFSAAGADLIYFHIETCPTPAKALEFAEQLKEMGCGTGIALNPGTKIEKIRNIAGAFDSVLVMSVQPGKGGQKFRKSALTKIIKLRAMKCHVNADGGIKVENISAVSRAGATRAVVGTAIFHGDAQNNLQELKQLI